MEELITQAIARWSQCKIFIPADGVYKAVIEIVGYSVTLPAHFLFREWDVLNQRWQEFTYGTIPEIAARAEKYDGARVCLGQFPTVLDGREELAVITQAV